MAFWQGVQNSTNTNDFKDYLRRYPRGVFATLARDRLVSLQRAASDTARQNSNAASEQRRLDATLQQAVAAGQFRASRAR